jgi:hypothetical protein
MLGAPPTGLRPTAGQPALPLRPSPPNILPPPAALAAPLPGQQQKQQQQQHQTRIEFTFHVVFSRAPVFAARSWVPSRKLEEFPSLAAFAADLPLRHGAAAPSRPPAALVITVVGPGVAVVDDLRDDAGFQSMIRMLKRRIAAQLAGTGAAAAGGGPQPEALVYDVEVEAMGTAPRVDRNCEFMI